MSTHTIGEVLNRLKDEFDDITISKIRFLEAEGLISPDRTESGYRKFTEPDIQRLRHVLRAQRDRYLPLKVIKEELARLDAGEELDVDLPGAPAGREDRASASRDSGPLDGALPQGRPPGDGEQAGDRPDVGPQAGVAAPPSFAAPASEVQFSSRELCDAAGISTELLAELREHGLLGKGPGYDGDDLQVTRIAAQLLDLGLEVRHLRMYRQFADREAALVEQLVTPLLRQRNPDSRRTAVEQAERLAAAGESLYQALLAKQLRSSLRR